MYSTQATDRGIKMANINTAANKAGVRLSFGVSPFIMQSTFGKLIQTRRNIRV